MADVFKMLLEGAQKTRAKKATNDKLKSILNNQESMDYENRNAGIGSDDAFSDFGDFSVGEERDATDHLYDIEKISLKELDKKPPKEQLKVLKLEYNRIYDKLTSLNQSVTNSERLISDLQMERRTDEEEVRQMKNLIRKIVHLFPGQTHLKDTVDRGSWKVDDVFEQIENLVANLLTRVKHTDQLLEEEIGKIKAENTALKEKILQYKAYLNKIDELEKLVIQQQNFIQQNALGKSSTPVQTSPSPTPTPTFNPTPASPPTPEPAPIEKPKPTFKEVENVPTNPTIQYKEKPDFTEIEDPFESEEEPSTEQNIAEHNPHFSDFFSEFKASFEKMKQTENIKETVVDSPNFKKEPEPKVDIFTPPQVYEEKSNPGPSNHPLSPDYVETEKEEVDDLFDESIDAYLQNLSVQQEYLLTIIGKTGISRNSDLKEYLKNDSLGQQYYFAGKKYNSNALNRDIAELRDKSILNDEEVSYGGKGGGHFNVYELSKTGKSCFKKLTGDNPVIPEKKRIKDHHASLEHGYLIKDSANIFREMGYKVYTDLEDVSIKIDSRHRKVFDFITENEEGKLMHIEVEMGTHTQDDFSYAMDKIYEITKEFYFICPNEQIKNKNTKKKFFTWVTKTLGGIQNADVILYTTTIEQLRKKQKNIWEVTDLRNVK